MRVTTRRVMFTLPAPLLERLDEAVRQSRSNRSTLIRQALERFLEEQKRQELRDLLKEGYIVHSDRDRRISESFAQADYEVTERYAPYDEDEE